MGITISDTMGKTRGAMSNKTIRKMKFTVKEKIMAKDLNACQGLPCHR
jgi:hypothetical protein